MDLEHCLKLQVQAVNGEEPTQNGEDSEAARKKNNKRKRRNADDKLEEISKFIHYTIIGRRKQAQHGASCPV
jgi:hypothetical protein